MTDVGDRIDRIDESASLVGQGPPHPLPDWLRPLQTPIHEGDLRVAPSTEELRCITKLLDSERLAGQVLLTQREGSPWLEVAVAVPLLDGHRAVVQDEVPFLREHGSYRYAIWRYTCLPYRLGPDGAVEDEPLWGRP